MKCKTNSTNTTKTAAIARKAEPATRLYFGADSKIGADDRLQNNIDLFEWAVRNKVYPNFWGRNISGKNALTLEEKNYLHMKGCKIAAIFPAEGEMKTEQQGAVMAKKADLAAFELNIPEGTAIFLELPEKPTATSAFLRGFAKALIAEGYTPGFKADTDAKFGFDREFSRAIQADAELMQNCLVWAAAPTLEEFDNITTSHFIRPDNWVPFAPSGIKRSEVAVWQYGKDCHPIYDDMENKIAFNINLVRNMDVIINKMF